MKTFNLKLPAMVFIAALGLLSAPATVLAQSPGEATTSFGCAASNVVAQAGTPVTSGSGYPDEGFDYTPPSPAADPKPVNPVTKTCENGQIQVMVGNKQQFGNRIGNIVEVRVLLLVKDGVTIDFTSLQRGIMKFDGTDRFHLALDNPVTITSEKGDGKTLFTIDLRLQSFVPRPTIAFNLDLRYATSMVAATQQPDWKVLTTPDFQVTTSNTLDNGEELLEGNMQPAMVALPPATRALLYTGIALLALWPLTAFIIWVARKRPGRKIPPHERAWQTLSWVFAEGDKSGYEERHYRHLVDALKGYLGVGTRTSEEVSSMLKDDARHDTILSALKKCDTALYKARHDGDSTELLPTDAVAELIAQIKSIVPRPD